MSEYKKVVEALESGNTALNWLAKVLDRADAKADAEILNAALPLARELVEKAERAESANLPDEADKLVQDAERYRWLRLHSWYENGGTIYFGRGYNQTEPNILDGVIDYESDLRGEAD